MARRNHGVLVPGIVFTLLACAGVLLLLTAGTPVVEQIAGRRVAGPGPGPRGVPVEHSATPSARPSATRAPSRPPVATTPPTSGATRPPAATTPPATQPASPPVTATPRCVAGSATVGAAADAYVDQAMPSRSYGDAGDLVVASRDKERNRRALVRFALPAIPSGCTLRSATLTLDADQPSGRRLLVSRASRGWNESSVTWATAPGAAGTASSATASGSVVRWTVTAQVQAMRSLGNYGFLVRDATEGAKNVPQTVFASRKRRGAPVLTLRWS